MDVIIGFHWEPLLNIQKLWVRLQTELLPEFQTFQWRNYLTIIAIKDIIVKPI